MLSRTAICQFVDTIGMYHRILREAAIGQDLAKTTLRLMLLAVCSSQNLTASQELSLGGRTMLRVTEYFAESFKSLEIASFNRSHTSGVLY